MENDNFWVSGSSGNIENDVFAMHNNLFVNANQHLEKAVKDIVASLAEFQVQIQNKLEKIKAKQHAILMKCGTSSSTYYDFAQNCSKIKRSLEIFSMHASNLAHIKLTIARCGSLVSSENPLANLVVEPTNTMMFAQTPYLAQETSLEQHVMFRPSPMNFSFQASQSSLCSMDTKRVENENGRRQKNTIFVFYLPPSIDTDDKLKHLFIPYGVIINAYVPKDANKKTRGFGFVDFQTAEEAQNAIKHMDKYQIDGKFLSVTLKI